MYVPLFPEQRGGSEACGHRPRLLPDPEFRTSSHPSELLMAERPQFLQFQHKKLKKINPEAVGF